MLSARLIDKEKRSRPALYRWVPINPRPRGWIKLWAGDLVPGPKDAKAEVCLRLDSREGRAVVRFDDVSVEEVDFPRIPETGRVVFEGAALVVWHEPPGREVWPESEPPSRRAPSVKLSAARGKFECFQLVVLPRRALYNCRWELKSLGGPRWLPIRRVEYVKLTKVSGPYGRKGLQPAPLLPALRPFSLLPRKA